MRLAISFTNFGPYHLARLRALGQKLMETGGGLLAYETASAEERYPWRAARVEEPFAWHTLFTGQSVECIGRALCAQAMERALAQSQPDAVAIVGYARPESMAALRWALGMRRPALLLSESQEIDRPRVWWKEAVKRRRVCRFSAALVGGESHRDYLVKLGMPQQRIALGYNAVDHAWFARTAAEVRRDQALRPIPRPYFLAVSRFVAEKNLPHLIRAYARYRQTVGAAQACDLVLCGDGPGAAAVAAAVGSSGAAHAIHRPGFLQAEALVRWYAFAAALVHPALSEPWGLVVNEAAACGLPLVVSNRAGCAGTLVPSPPGTTGWQLDPTDEHQLTSLLVRLGTLPEADRAAMGQRAAKVASRWGPERFACGVFEALALAQHFEQTRLRTRPRCLVPARKEVSA